MVKKTGAIEIYEKLKSQILDLTLEPGSYLDEGKIAETFGFSRSPVREALIRLTSEKLVENPQNRGAIVAPFEFKQLAAFQEALALIYGSTCRLAAVNRTDAHIKSIEHAGELCESAREHGTRNERIRTNKDFHIAIAESAENNYLTWSLITLLDHGERILRMSAHFSKEIYQNSNTTHEEIIEAIRARDATRAESAGKADAIFLKAVLLE